MSIRNNQESQFRLCTILAEVTPTSWFAFVALLTSALQTICHLAYWFSFIKSSMSEWRFLLDKRGAKLLQHVRYLRVIVYDVSHLSTSIRLLESCWRRNHQGINTYRYRKPRPNVSIWMGNDKTIKYKQSYEIMNYENIQTQHAKRMKLKNQWMIKIWI